MAWLDAVAVLCILGRLLRLQLLQIRLCFVRIVLAVVAAICYVLSGTLHPLLFSRAYTAAACLSRTKTTPALIENI